MVVGAVEEIVVKLDRRVGHLEPADINSMEEIIWKGGNLATVDDKIVHLVAPETLDGRPEDLGILDVSTIGHHLHFGLVGGVGGEWVVGVGGTLGGVAAWPSTLGGHGVDPRRLGQRQPLDLHCGGGARLPRVLRPSSGTRARTRTTVARVNLVRVSRRGRAPAGTCARRPVRLYGRAARARRPEHGPQHGGGRGRRAGGRRRLHAGPGAGARARRGRHSDESLAGFSCSCGCGCG